MSGVFFYEEFNDHDLKKDGKDLTEKFNEIVKDLEGNKCTNLGDIKLIKGDGDVKYFRAKLSGSDRLLFISIKHDDKDAFVILEVIPNHNYHKSKFLTNKEKIRSIKIIDQNSTEVSDTVEIEDNPQVRWLGKFITLSATQEKIVENAKLPLIVSGSAGSGKTSVALEKFRKIEEKFEEGKVLYITQSENLIKQSKELYEYVYWDETANDFKIGIPDRIEFLSLHEFLEKRAEDIKGKKPIDRSKFFSWFNEVCKKEKFKEYTKDGDKIFEEFTAVIAGVGLTKKEEYKELGSRQAIFPKEKRDDIYGLFEEYKGFTEGNLEYYDPNLIAHECAEEKIYDAVVVDEAQDLTESTLGLILKSLKNGSERNFLLCGDVNQVIHPSFFSLSKLKSFLYQNKYIRDQGPQIFYALEKNYRNSEQVIELANRVLHLKNYCFASEDKITVDNAFFMKSDTKNKGNVSFVADDKKEEIAEKVCESINWAVLVLNDESKEDVCQLFDTPLVFNIHEAKGLEFENIILYKFTSHKAYDEVYKKATDKKKAEDVICEIRDLCNRGEFNTSRSRQKEDKSFEKYKFYMNALYVGISRAIDSVYIIDDDKKCNLLKVIKPERIGNIDIKAEESSPEEWKVMALELIDKGNIEQAENIAEKLRKKGEKGYVKEIMNALEAKGYDKERAVSELKTEPQKSLTMVSNEKREQSKNKKKLTKKELGENTNRLFEALKKDNVQEAKKLIEQGINVNAKDQTGYTPLHCAVLSGYQDIAKLLLMHGANIDAKSTEIQTKGSTSLHFALGGRDAKSMIELLLKYGADVNAKNNVGNTPLQLARIKGNKNIVQLLLEHGAKQNKNENQEDGIEVFISKLRNNEAIDKLKKAGVSHYDTQQVLMDIICNDKIDELKKIDISQYDKKHILEFSLQKSAFKITEFLIKDKGFTPKNSDFSVGHLGGDDFALLLQACQYGFFSVAKFLLHYQSDHSKNLLLPWAAKEYHSDVVKLLNNGNAKLGSTPLYEAAQKGKEDLALLHKKVINLFLADSSINIGHVKVTDFTDRESKLEFLSKLQQDNALFNKVKEVKGGKDEDKLLKEIEDLLNKKNQLGFEPSLNYSPDGNDENTTLKIAIKAGREVLQLLYDYAEKEIGVDTKIFKRLKQAREQQENSQPRSAFNNVSTSQNLAQVKDSVR